MHHMRSVSNALANITKAQEHQKKKKKTSDAKHNTNTKLNVGDKVLVKDMKNAERKGGKLNKLFPGKQFIQIGLVGHC